SSFSQKDVVTPLAPSTPLSPLLPLRRQWLPLSADSHPAKGRPPLQLAPPLLLAAGLAAGGSPLWTPTANPLCRDHAARRCARGQLPPLRAAALVSGTSLPCGLAMAAVGRPLTGGLGHGLVVGGRPCMEAGSGWPPLLLAAFTAKT
ncbi:hypothetical protein GW17_00054710, partial [Ensete ventricosum]